MLLAQDALPRFELTSLIYDFTPVKFSHDGAVVTPSFLSMRNLPADMAKVWCEDGFYQIDPVQQLAFRSHLPFAWSYRSDGKTPLNRILAPAHKPVVDYVHDMRITCGVTVPVHMPDGECAVVTGVRQDADDDFEATIGGNVATFALFAHVLHEKIYPLFDEEALRARPISLTPRERECVAYAAQGLSAKEISKRLERAVPTVVMHLNAAARKLSATNRAQLIARAAHYRLIGTS
ncbi:LuxR family transcriptional regulator [Aurantimonas endophytica]|uniref:LuxR family transcriptional regulator n=1 Tax=Aurantimonas endophytica TaxID=1522175 RepID=A0A7W6HBL9_9HYPH|nr:LuxR family transcriptional regulator [Aurantimonas endophytica]MBB4002112.1 LuxR family transcriptional regulator [Aurantimonas endophytica]MCO6402256.1 LuxR family transcriptional regulator [Aurantimonas endophytica]